MRLNSLSLGCQTTKCEQVPIKLYWKKLIIITNHTNYNSYTWIVLLLNIKILKTAQWQQQPTRHVIAIFCYSLQVMSERQNCLGIRANESVKWKIIWCTQYTLFVGLIVQIHTQNYLKMLNENCMRLDHGLLNF